MLLIQIKDYILSQKEVTLPQLAVHFNLPESAIEDMAEHWVQKKTFEKLKLATGNLHDSSGCEGCTSECVMREVVVQPSASSIILYRPY